jgi:hypothetical protein
MHRDPMETSRDDGAACSVCGEDAVYIASVLQHGRLQRFPICVDCYELQVVHCPGCALPLFAIDGPYCSAACTPDYVIEDLERAARGDINRDDIRR